jgi:sugar phosphate permease
MHTKKPTLPFHYAWVIVGITFLTLVSTAGIRSTPGVLIVPLQAEFGWSRASISLAVSINLFLYGLIGPFAAAFMERFGIRRVMMTALFTASSAAFLTTFMNQVWQLDLLWGLVIGIATGSTASVLSAVVANKWFVKRRGLVVGLLTASNATGQLAFLPLLAGLITSTGWRTASLIISGVALVLIPLVWLLMRNNPHDIGLQAYGAEPDSDEVKPTTSLSNPLLAPLHGLMRGVRSKDFWWLAGSFFICGATTNGLIGTHLIPAAMDHGIAEVTAAGLLATIGIFDIIGTTVSGFLSDHFDNRWLLCWYYSLRGLALLFLPYALGSTFLSLAVFVVFYGLDWVATVPPTVRLCANIFGKQNVGIIFGWVLAAHQLGAAFAAFGAGALYTWLGDYQVSFMTAGVLCLLAAGMVIRIGRSSSTKGKTVKLPIPETQTQVQVS